jgi:hypothetical protein
MQDIWVSLQSIRYLNGDDQEEERRIQNFKSRPFASKQKMNNFGSWTQTSVTQMKERLGVEPKRQ